MWQTYGIKNIRVYIYKINIPVCISEELATPVAVYIRKPIATFADCFRNIFLRRLHSLSLSHISRRIFSLRLGLCLRRRLSASIHAKRRQLIPLRLLRLNLVERWGRG